MSNLVAVARDTLGVISSGHYTNKQGKSVAVDLRPMMDGEKVHLSPTTLPAPGRPTLNISVTSESSLEACRRIGDGVGLLSFASAHRPGGGFLSGAQAQEESIARSSGLYASLMYAKEFYKANKHSSALYTDAAIWSPHVPIFKDDSGAPLDKPHHANVLTIPAPNAGAWLLSGSARELDASLNRRMEVMFSRFTEHGAKDLVLGAWGCGVFGNDPEVVAWAFKNALKKWPFDSATFAIYRGGEVANTFKRVLLS